MWLTNSVEPQRTAMAGTEPEGSSGQRELSARELLKQGKALFQAGRYAEAIRALESADKAPGGLTLSEGRELREYLQWSRDEMNNPFGDRPAVTTGGGNPGAAANDPAARARVNDLMQRALSAERQGNKPEALRLAQAAQAVAQTAGIRFAPAEQNPTSVINRLSGQVAAVAAASGDRFEMPVARGAASAPALEIPEDASPAKRQALVLMHEAQAALAVGDYDRARAKALQAQEMDTVWTLLELQPHHLLAEIERKTGTSTITPESKRVVPAIADNTMRGGIQQTRADLRGTALPPSASGSSDKASAEALLASAREDLKAGRLDAARAKAMEAQKLNVTYGLLEDRPELVMDDVRRFEAFAANVAQSGSQAAPGADAGQKQKALALLAEARRDMQAGDLDSARAKAAEAQKLNVSYDLFDDRPDLVVQTIERYAQTYGNIAQATTPPVEAEMESDPFGSDRAVVQANQTLISEADPSDFAPPIQITPQVHSSGGRGEDPFGGAAAPATPVISANGASGLELYNRGMQHLRDGDTDLAYQAFLAAHQTGEQLDPHRTQSLQDKLRELAPQANRIRLAANEHRAGSNDPFATGSRLGGLETADKQQSAQYDRLRTETLNAIFRADGLREKNPEQAIEIIDRAMATVGGSGLDQKMASPLLAQLTRARAEVEQSRKLREPLVALEKRNAETKELIEQKLQHKVRVEQELADLVEQFNQLFEQRRYAEAEVIAKQAKDLDPENPVTETLFWKARFARRIARDEEIKLAKEEGFVGAMQAVDMASIPFNKEIEFPKNWGEMSKRRKDKYGPDNRIRTDEEIRIEKSLDRQISLHFESTPLAQVIKHIATVADINIVLDRPGLEEEGVTSNTPVSIDVDGIRLSSALNLVLQPFNLDYMIEDEVLKITSRLRQQGRMEVVTYPVADLVVPLPNFVANGGLQTASSMPNVWGGNLAVPSSGGVQQPGGAQFQVQDPMMPVSGPSWTVPGMSGTGDTAGQVDFDSLHDLIVSTIEPESWAEMGGQGMVRHYETTLSLVIRQTQRVHEEIRDLLDQLRRLQDLQVTIEVRFISVVDRFFERIGIDFDFNVNDNNAADTTLLPPFGVPSILVPGQFGAIPAQQGQQQQGQQQGQQQQQGGAPIDASPFDAPQLLFPSLDQWPKGGTVVGLNPVDGSTFQPDLDIPFRQGSFGLGVPDFGNFQPDAGISVGMAILTDIEAFFFIQAAQTDERSNVMFAPKVTLFNGQVASVSSFVARPFVTSLVPTVGFASVGFTPQITVIPDGVFMTVLAVISADRRFVRLTVSPQFTTITDVQSFSFAGGGAAGAGLGGGGAQQGQAGGFTGGIGGLGGTGGLGGGLGGGFGVGGIGGGPTEDMMMLSMPTQPLPAQSMMMINDGLNPMVGFGGIGGGHPALTLAPATLLQQQAQQQQGQQQQGQQQQGQQAAGTLTVQQPITEIVSVQTTVSVPDGGTVLLGGVKRLREGRNMAGVPILNKLPYISRLFKNTGVGRETESLMLMVTPRIIIQEEEEELLLGIAP